MTEQWHDVIKTHSGKYVMIDTRWNAVCPINREWETMAFKCDESGKVTDWENYLDRRNYSTKEQAEIGHAEIVNKYIKL